MTRTLNVINNIAPDKTRLLDLLALVHAMTYPQTWDMFSSIERATASMGLALKSQLLVGPRQKSSERLPAEPACNYQHQHIHPGIRLASCILLQSTYVFPFSRLMKFLQSGFLALQRVLYALA